MTWVEKIKVRAESARKRSGEFATCPLSNEEVLKLVRALEHAEVTLMAIGEGVGRAAWWTATDCLAKMKEIGNAKTQ